MKRILSLSMAVLLLCALMLTGCGDKKPGDTSNDLSGSDYTDDSGISSEPNGPDNSGDPDDSSQADPAVSGGTENPGTSSNPVNPGGPGKTTTTTKPKTTTTGKIELPKLSLKGNKVKYLGWGNGKDFTKEGTDLYAYNKMLKDNYGAEIQFVRTTYDELPTKLAQLVLAKDSPDLVHYKYQDNPGFVLNNLVMEITPDLIDFDSALWSGVKDVNQEYAFKGKIFTPVVDIINDGYIYYHVQKFKEAGLETPLELYRKGQWTWAKCMELAEQLTVKGSDGAVKTYGFAAAPEYFYMTCGEDFVKTNADGTLSNNLSSQALAKAMNFFYRSGTAGTNCRMMIGSYDQEFLAGNIVMFHEEAWARSYMYDKMKSGDIRIAPSPKMTGSNKYYVNSLISTLWIAKNAPNAQGAAAYLSIMRYMATEPKARESARAEEMKKMGFTAQEYALIDEMNDRSKFTFTRRIGPGVGNFGNTDMCSMFNEVVCWDIPWPTCVEKYTPLLQAEIDTYNQKVKAYKSK